MESRSFCQSASRFPFFFFTVATVENRSVFRRRTLNLTEPSHASNCLSRKRSAFATRQAPPHALPPRVRAPLAPAEAGAPRRAPGEGRRAVRGKREDASAAARAARELQRRDAAQPGREAEHRVPPRAPRFWRATHEGSARGGHRRHERRRASRADAPSRRRRKRARAGERRRTAGGRRRRERVHGGRRVRRGPDVRAAADGVQHGSTRCSTREGGRAVRAGEPRARSRGGAYGGAPPRGEKGGGARRPARGAAARPTFPSSPRGRAGAGARRRL